MSSRALLLVSIVGASLAACEERLDFNLRLRTTNPPTIAVVEPTHGPGNTPVARGSNAATCACPPNSASGLAAHQIN
jgi:hypothetical protein